MSQKKALYVTSTFGELQKLGEVKNKNLKNGAHIFNSMAKLYKQAEESILDGDEERAYIFYMRFFNLLQFVRKTPEFHKQIEQITSLLGGKSGLDRTLDQLENLTSSLRDRYNEQNVSQTVPEVPVAATKVNETPTPVPMVPSSVTCKQFYEYIKDNAFSLLVIDCRPQKDFEASKIKYEHMFNIPEEMLVKGTTVSKIAGSLSGDDLKKWTSRLYKSHIILVDQSSCDFITDSPVWVLKDVLQNWDVDFENKAPVQLLSGGFGSFQTYYPTEVTNPRYQPVQDTFETDTFDDIQYPDSVFQLSISSPGNRMPVIDRASKTTALQTYAEREKHFQQIMEKHDKVLNESIDLEKERLRAEEDWKAITEEDVENKDTSRGQEVLHKIWELEIKARDMEDKDEQLKEHERNFLEKLSKQEAEKLEEQARRREQEAKEKEQKKREYEEQMKRLVEDREKKLKENIAPKQNFAKIKQEPIEKPIQITRPQPFIPDRSAKPHLPQIYIPDRKRDFSPVGQAMVSKRKLLSYTDALYYLCYLTHIHMTEINSVVARVP